MCSSLYISQSASEGEQTQGMHVRYVTICNNLSVADILARLSFRDLHGCSLQAKPWLCVSCQLQHGKIQRATKLFLHPMSYLSKPQPLVYDMGPTPACGSQECATYSTKMAHDLMADVVREVTGEKA
jgi:hypothetical protein